MPRLFGILLMLATGAVATRLACQALQDPWSIGIAIGVSLFVIGLLFGFLDCHRHRVWATIAAVVVTGVVFRATLPPDPAIAIATSQPPRPVPVVPAHYLVPILAALAGSHLGARIITAKVRASTRPQDEPEP